MTAAAGTRSRRRHSWQQRDSLLGYLFVAPSVLGAVLLVILPLGAVAWYSLHDWNALSGQFRFTGAENYTALLEDSTLHASLVSSVLFSSGVAALNISLALLLAVLLNQKVRGSTFFRVLFFSPVVVSLVAWSIVWGFLLQNSGGINAFFGVIGIDGPNWLREGWSALLAVVVVQVFKNVGLNMVLFLAALQGVPEEMLEAARIDGAGAVRRFFSITLPMISPTLLLVSIITVVGSLETFALIDVLTAGGPGNSTNVLVYYFYQRAFRFNDFGYASAIAMLLFVIVLVLTLLQWQTRRRWVHHER
ncbi:carbohydrate ABC transporter permease [Brachybacterium sp. AOP35-5H-19]|uniref:carbohydrate ABC transporter permease n=1 Tax=Brachybacterium sp. AOP35-5H-19 TaxID=3457685 RepID=UPI004034ADC0